MSILTISSTPQLIMATMKRVELIIDYEQNTMSNLLIMKLIVPRVCGMTSYEGDLSDWLLGPTPDATPLWDDVMLRGQCRTESSRHLPH